MTRQHYRTPPIPAPDDRDAATAHPGPGVDDPTAEVVEIKPYRHTRGLRVRCPFGKPHEHLHGLGWETDERDVQHRVAYCGGGGYYIIVPAYAAELVRPGSRRRDGTR